MSDLYVSDIQGEGFGSSHEWRGDTPQDNSKRTFYVCASCGASFCHQYNRQPEIFAAIEEAGVPNECGAEDPQ